jgi:hypothetical protein
VPLAWTLSAGDRPCAELTDGPFAHKRPPEHLHRSRIPHAARQPSEPVTIARIVSRLRYPVRCCARRLTTTRLRSRCVLGRRRAVGGRARGKRRSEAPRACEAGAAGAARYPNLRAHLRTRAEPTQHSPLHPPMRSMVARQEGGEGEDKVCTPGNRGCPAYCGWILKTQAFERAHHTPTPQMV